MNGSSWTDIFTAIAAGATALGTLVTAVGVVLAWVQLKASKELTRTQFEDSLDREYRVAIRNIPLKALLGEKLGSNELEEALKYFYQYIDLSNNQIFLRQQDRVSTETWKNWQDGIKSLMQMPAFSDAWKQIREKTTTKFDELRRLEASKYRDDPHDWKEDSDRTKRLKTVE